MSDWNVSKIRESHLELSAKTKLKKQLRREALARWRADRTDTVSYTEFLTQHAKSLERGSCARYWGLCRAYAVGMPYRRVEKSTRPGHAPSAQVLVDLLCECTLEPIPSFHAQQTKDALVVRIRDWLGSGEGPSHIPSPKHLTIGAQV
jgi:hypothetical protein